MFIENCAAADMATGFHKDPGPNAMLIQITDPASWKPTPKHSFYETHHFEFLDIEDRDVEANPDWEECAISDNQARELARLLEHASTYDMNVVVHCFAGICRSGAVTEVGVMMGFEDPGKFRQSNLRVKHKMLRALGMYYDPDENNDDAWVNYPRV